MAVPNTTSFAVLFIVVALIFASCAGGRRGTSEHQVRQMRPTRGFNEMELSVARNFGKRAVNMHVVNSILLEWLALESKMKNLRQRGNLPLPLALPLERVRNAASMAEVPDDIAPGDGVLLDE